MPGRSVLRRRVARPTRFELATTAFAGARSKTANDDPWVACLEAYGAVSAVPGSMGAAPHSSDGLPNGPGNIKLALRRQPNKNPAIAGGVVQFRGASREVAGRRPAEAQAGILASSSTGSRST